MMNLYFSTTFIKFKNLTASLLDWNQFIEVYK